MADNEVKVIMTMVDKMTPTAKNMQRSLGDMGKDFLKTHGLAVGLGAGVLAVTKFMRSSITDTVSYARSVRDMGRALGTSAEEASTLIQVADDLMIPIGTLELAFKSALKQGVLPSVQGLKDLAAEYQGLPPGAAQAQFALEKFGRAGLEMQKILELSPQTIDEMAQSAEDAGLVLSGEAVDSAREYEIAMDNLGDTVEGLKTSIGVGLIPVVTEATTALNDIMNTSINFGHALDAVNEAYEKNLITEAERKKMRDDLRWADQDLYDFTTQKIFKMLEEEHDRMIELGGANDAYMESLRNMSVVIDETSPSRDEINNQLLTMGINADTAREELEDLSDIGIRAMSDAMLEELRIRSVLEIAQITMSDLTEEEKDRRIALIDAEMKHTERIKEVTEARDLGNISWSEWALIMQDGKVTIQEWNDIFLDTKGKVDDLTNGIIIMGGEIRGLPSQWDINIDIWYKEHGQPIIQGGQINWQHGVENFVVPPGFPNDTFRVGLTSGEVVTVKPTTTNNYNLTINSRAPTENMAADFQMLKALAR